MASFAEDGKALRRRGSSTELWQWRRKKTEEEEKWRRRRLNLYNMAQKQEEAMPRSSPRQCDAKDGHDHDWKPKEARRRWQLPDGTVQLIYQIAIRLKFKLLPNLCNNSKISKNKVVQNSKLYNFAFIPIPKFGLHSEMQIWIQKGTL